MKAVLDYLRSGVNWEGSTRPLALVRISFMFLLWARYAMDFGPYRYLATPGVALCCAAFYVFTVLAFVGLWTRAATAAVAIVMTLLRCYYHQHLDVGPGIGAGPWQVAFFLAFTPCGRSLSLDRWLALRRAKAAGVEPPDERAPLWSQILLMGHLSAVYFFAAYDKIGPDWTTGFRLEGIFLDMYGYSELMQQGSLVHLGAVASAWATLFVEFGLGIGLWVPRWRRWVIAMGIALHFSFFLFLALWPLSGRMVLLYLLFIDPDRLHTVMDQLMGHDHHE